MSLAAQKNRRAPCAPTAQPRTSNQHDSQVVGMPTSTRQAAHGRRWRVGNISTPSGAPRVLCSPTAPYSNWCLCNGDRLAEPRGAGARARGLIISRVLPGPLSRVARRAKHTNLPAIIHLGARFMHDLTLHKIPYHGLHGYTILLCKTGKAIRHVL